ncbi:MAG: ABC transporter ATP-binding protein [Phycisphaerae bacterium]
MTRNDSQSDPPAIVEMQHVGYRLEQRAILDDISWQIQPGQNWAILGANGAGKTTLLRIACGFLWPNAGGTVLRNGKKLLDLRLLRRSIGWVTAEVARRIPAGEHVGRTVVSGRFGQMGLWPPPFDEPQAELWAQADRRMQQLKIEHLAGRTFGTLSQGETQKVLIARALMALPLLLILDEPCAGLDPAAREHLLRDLANLAEQDDAPGLIYVTHHIEQILPCMQNCLALRDGRILAAGPTRGVLTDSMLSELYDIPVRLHRHNGRWWPVCG